MGTGGTGRTVGKGGNVIIGRAVVVGGNIGTLGLLVVVVVGKRGFGAQCPPAPGFTQIYAIPQSRLVVHAIIHQTVIKKIKNNNIKYI